jgi:hypothetical protein
LDETPFSLAECADVLEKPAACSFTLKDQAALVILIKRFKKGKVFPVLN